MQTQKQFTIKIQDKIFTSNEDRFLNLNEIHKAFGLKPSKRPSEFLRYKTGAYFKANGKSRSLKNPNQGKGEAAHFIIADEDATIAYAMWIDLDFYISVVEAFRLLRNGEFEKATEIAMSTMSESDAHYLKRQAKLKGMFWDEACAYAGIKSPRLLKKYLNANYKFTYFDAEGNVEEVERAEELFYNRGNKFTSSVRLCVTPKGREWLKEHRVFFNEKAELMRK